MKPLLGNLGSVQNFTFDGKVLCDEDDLVVRINAGRIKYKYDGKERTDEIDGIQYHCVHLESTSDFDVIFDGVEPPIPLEELKEGYIFTASLPMSEAIVKITAIEYGKMRFSIRVPRIDIIE